MAEENAQERGPLPSSERSDPTKGILSVWRSVRKYWVMALAIAIAVTVAVAFRTLGQVKIYEAAATLQFDPRPPRPLGKNVEAFVEMGAGYWDIQEYYETQYKIITSMRLATIVTNDLVLHKDGGFLSNTPPGQTPPAITSSVEGAAGLLRSRIRVEPIKNSRLAVVKYEDADPARAQRILSAIIDSYVSLNLDDALASTNAAADWLRGQTEKLKEDLEGSEMALHDYKKNKNILSVAFDDQSNMLREEMTTINEARAGVRTRREEIAARLAELSKVDPESPQNLPSSELLQSAKLQDLRGGYETALRDYKAEKAGGKGENHPDVKKVAERLAITRTALVDEIKNIQGALQGDLNVLTRQEKGLNKLFAGAQKQALELNLLEIEYNRLRRSKENTEKLYSVVLERSKESDLTRMLRVNNISILDRPLLPGAPIRPRVTMNIAMGALAGIFLGLAAAAARGFLDRSIKIPDDIEQDLGVTCLGLLPEIDESAEKSSYYARRRRGKVQQPGSGIPELVVHEKPMSGIAEAARAIRTNLMFMSPDDPHRTLLITSAGPGEGKTTVACCIATAMAQAGKTVVLVDCDLRRPRVHRIFKTGSERGVTTALLTDEIDQAIHRSSVPNLSILPAGPIPPNPAELLHSEKFKHFLRQLEARFDRVILDSPPVVAVTDAAILATIADGCVLVVRAFKTRKELGRHALRALFDVGAKPLGAVLNAVNLSRHEYKTSYYYYRRDEYYSADGQPPAPPAPPSPPAAGPSVGSPPAPPAAGPSSATVAMATVSPFAPPPAAPPVESPGGLGGGAAGGGGAQPSA